MDFIIFVFCLPLIVPVIALFGILRDSIKQIKEENKEEEIIYTSEEDINWNCHLKYNNPDSLPCFTFEQIKTFYYTAPKKWNFSVFTIYYSKSNCNQIKITTPTKEDYILTERFFEEREKEKQKQKQIETTLALLPYLREDAKKAQEEADNMLAQCEIKVRNIADNLNEEKRSAATKYLDTMTKM